jgi:hypothetical protein
MNRTDHCPACSGGGLVPALGCTCDGNPHTCSPAICTDEDPVIGCLLVRDVRFFPEDATAAPPGICPNIIQERAMTSPTGPSRPSDADGFREAWAVIERSWPTAERGPPAGARAAP